MQLGRTVSQGAPVVKGRAREPLLSEVSEKDAKWDKHRGNTQTIGALYDRAHDPQLERLGERMAECSGVLRFAQAVDMETGEVSIKLDRAMFCKVRHCPVCQWRRGMRNVAKFYDRLPGLITAYPKSRWIFVTLTAKNPDMADLRSTLATMNAAWKRLIELDSSDPEEFRWPAKGFIRTTEVTKGRDGKPHPHFHALLLVPSSYFKGGAYVSAEKWAETWKKCLRADYLPVVHVQAVKAKSAKAKAAEANGDKVAALSAAVAETLKYSVKPEDMLTDAAFLFGITTQLHKLRFIATGGVLKDWLKEEATDKEMVKTGDLEEDAAAAVQPDLPGMTFGWQPGERKYRRVKSAKA